MEHCAEGHSQNQKQDKGEEIQGLERIGLLQVRENPKHQDSSFVLFCI